jgi:hypothetical protein
LYVAQWWRQCSSPATELLAEEDNWKSLSFGKLDDLSVLVTLTDGTELYDVFNKDKAADAKALFAWACGDGLKRPSREETQSRVLALMNPEKYAEKQAAKTSAKQAAQGDAEDSEEQATPAAPKNLISTETRVTPPDWKDVPDGVAALFQEGCKQAPGHSAKMMRDFARQFVWTAAIVKGLIADMAESKDGEEANAISCRRRWDASSCVPFVRSRCLGRSHKRGPTRGYSGRGKSLLVLNHQRYNLWVISQADCRERF